MGWEEKASPLAMGWRLWDLLCGASTAGWQWMGPWQGRGQPGRGSWWTQVGLSASWDKELVLLPRQAEGPQPSCLPQLKYLTLLVVRSGKHFSKTLLLKENRKLPTSHFFKKMIYFVPAFPCQQMCQWEVGCDLLFIPPSPWDSLAQDKQPLWDMAEGWVETGTALVWSAIYTLFLKMWLLGFRKQPSMQPSMCCG